MADDDDPAGVAAAALSELRPAPLGVPALRQAADVEVSGMRPPLVWMQGIVKRYGATGGSLGAAGATGVYALRGLNVQIGRGEFVAIDRKSTRLNSSHIQKSRMPSSA